MPTTVTKKATTKKATAKKATPPASDNPWSTGDRADALDTLRLHRHTADRATNNREDLDDLNADLLTLKEERKALNKRIRDLQERIAEQAQLCATDRADVESLLSVTDEPFPSDIRGDALPGTGVPLFTAYAAHLSRLRESVDVSTMSATESVIVDAYREYDLPA